MSTRAPGGAKEAGAHGGRFARALVGALLALTSGCGGHSATHDASATSTEGQEGGPSSSDASDVAAAGRDGGPASDASDATVSSDASDDVVAIDASLVAATTLAFCDQRASAWCAFLQRCDPAAPAVTECLAAEKARCLAPFAAAPAADAGRPVDPDPRRIAACLGAIESQRCELFGEPPQCEAAATCGAPLKEGASCATVLDCEPGADCANPFFLTCAQASDPTTCTCGPARGPGAPCNVDKDCFDGLVCDARICRVQTRGKGAACAVLSRCTDGLACFGPIPFSDAPDWGVCRDLLPLDVSCILDQCEAGLTCVFKPNGEGTCRPGLKLGDPCSFGVCPRGAFCNYEGVCRARPGLGDVCTDETKNLCWGAHLTCAAGVCTAAQARQCPN